MNTFDKIFQIAEICEAILEASGLYLDNKKVTPEEWRKFMQKRNEMTKALMKDVKKEKGKEEVNEEDEKKHWTQNKPSETNQYFKNKYSKSNSSYAEGQRKIVNAYQNYLDKKAKGVDAQATEMYLQAKKEAEKAFKDFRSGKVSAKEYAQKRRVAQKLRPGATSEYTQDKFNKSQERKNQTYNN